MAVKALKPGLTQILTDATVATRRIPKELAEPIGGLFPVRLASYRMDEYRVVNGWPVQVPEMDVRARSLVSSEGYVLTDRESARSITTSAFVRWIADEDTYSGDLRWFSYQMSDTEYFTTSPSYAPVLITDYEYRFGSEVFFTSALNFDADSSDHLNITLRSLAGSAGYTVILVASLNSVFGNSELPHSGIWCAQDNPTGGWMNVTLQGTDLYLATDQTPRRSALPIGHLVGSAAPLMLAMVFGHPHTTLFAASGPSALSSVRIDTGSQVVALDPNIYLGRTAADLNHTADMALMELGIYADQLTSAQVRAEFAALSSVYGGDR